MSAGAIDVVVLTQGRRPESLEAILAALRRQTQAPDRVVVVRNGGEPVSGLAATDAVELVELVENVGIPAGRNAGLDRVVGDLVLFLDDDVTLDDPDLLARFADHFADRPGLGLVQPRVRPLDGDAPRRWVPRLRDKDPYRSSPITVVWEGAVVGRTAVVRAAGGWPAPLFYAHEGIELGWRIWDEGFEVEYWADVEVGHPAMPEGRHPQRRWFSARNRVLMARRALPAPVAVVYVCVRGVLEVAQCRRGEDLRQFVTGSWTGLRMRAERRPIRWSTVRALTRAGRPPII
jgi:GT2 family glycosyltransferase